jgi:hypothetical protein
MKAIPSPFTFGYQPGPGVTPGYGPGGFTSAIEGEGGGGGVSSLTYIGRGSVDGDGGGLRVSPCLGCMGRGSSEGSEALVDEGVVSGDAMNTLPCTVSVAGADQGSSPVQWG